MTREEAIAILKCGRPFDDNPKADLDEFNLALGVAIKAIKNEITLLERKKDIITQETRLYYNQGHDHYRLEDRIYIPIDTVLEIIDEISDNQVIQFGCMAYGDGKAELMRRVLALKG